MDEIWKPVVVWKNNIKYDYSGFYEVSNFGNVRIVNRIDSLGHGRIGKVLKPILSSNGYLRYGLRNGNKKQEHFFGHRLVWEAFNGKIPEGMQINHLSEIKTENNLSNLEVVTISQNCIWGTRIERVSNKNKNNCGNKIILQFDLEGNLVKEWKSQKEIERNLGYYQTNISSCCKGKYKHAYGYVWKFKGDVN